MIGLIITEWLGLEQSLKVMEVQLCAVGREPGTLFRIYRPNAPISAGDQAGLQVPVRALLGAPLPPLHGALLLW